MSKQHDISGLSEGDKEKCSGLLAEIRKLRDLQKGAAPELIEELRIERMELVLQVTNIINQGKTVITTNNHN